MVRQAVERHRVTVRRRRHDPPCPLLHRRRRLPDHAAQPQWAIPQPAEPLELNGFLVPNQRHIGHQGSQVPRPAVIHGPLPSEDLRHGVEEG